MARTPEHDARIAKMVFSTIWPLYVNKIEKKGRTESELRQVVCWLTGYSDRQLQKHIDGDTTYAEFFEGATLHPNAHLINGVVCGYRIEEIETVLTRDCRRMEKLIEELARGRKMEKILRSD